MSWAIEKALPLLVFLLFTSPTSCSKEVITIGDAKVPPNETIGNASVKMLQDEAKKSVKMSHSGEEKSLAKLDSALKCITQNNNSRQLFLWLPYEHGIKFLNRAFYYLNNSELFRKEQVSGFIRDDEDDMIEILKEKTESGVFSKKGLDKSMNYDMAGYMVDVCHGDVSLSKMKVIVGALAGASIDTIGKKHSSVKKMVKFIDHYRKSPIGGCTDADRSYGGSADGPLFLWSPYEQAFAFLEGVYHYLNQSEMFKDRPISELTKNEKGSIVEILKEKMKSGEFSTEILEKSTNFDMSNFMVDICHGDVSDQQMTVIADAMTRASSDMGKECSSVKQIIEYIDSYEEIAGGRHNDDGRHAVPVSGAGGDGGSGTGFGEGSGASYGAGEGTGPGFGSNAGYDYGQNDGAPYGQGAGGGSGSRGGNGAGAGAGAGAGGYGQSAGQGDPAEAGPGSGTNYPYWTGYSVATGPGAGAGSGKSYGPGSGTGAGSGGGYGPGAGGYSQRDPAEAGPGSGTNYPYWTGYSVATGPGEGTGSGMSYASGAGTGADSGGGYGSGAEDDAVCSSNGGDGADDSSGSGPDSDVGAGSASGADASDSDALSECGMDDDALYDIWRHISSLMASVNPRCFSDSDAFTQKFFSMFNTKTDDVS